MTTTNVPVRSINDLGLVPREILPKNLSVFAETKVPVGNLPVGIYGEAFNIDVFSRVLGFFITSTTGLAVSKGEMVELVNQETIRAKLAEELLRQGITATNYGSGKAYKTLAAADLDKANIPANTPVVITNDPLPENNGMYTWDGVVFTKSSFDYFKMAKAYFNENYSTMDKRLLGEITSLKNMVNILSTGNISRYLFSVKGRYYKTGKTDRDQGYDIYTNNFIHTGLIYLQAGATATAKVLQQNLNNSGDVSNLLVLNMNLEKILDLSKANVTEFSQEWMDYSYTATENCYVVFTSIRFDGTLDNIYATVTNDSFLFSPFQVRSWYDRYLVRQIAADRFARAKENQDATGTLVFPFDVAERIFPKDEQPEGNSDLANGGDIYNNAYRTTGLIPMEIGDYIKATVAQPDSNIQAMAILDTNLMVLRTEKATFEETGIAGDRYPWTYEFQAEQRCYVVFCTINPALAQYKNDSELCARLTLGSFNGEGYTPRLRPTEDIKAKRSNVDRLVVEKLEQIIPFKGPGFAFVNLGYQWVEGNEYWDAYTGTDYFPINVGDTLTIQVDANETGGYMSILNVYDSNKKFIRCVYDIPTAYREGKTFNANLNWVSDVCGFATVSSIHRPGWSYPFVIKNKKALLNKHLDKPNSKRASPTLFTLPKPTSIIQLDMVMDTSLPPSTKDQGSYNCAVKLMVDGVSLEADTIFAVQGSSSASYAKKNWSFDFFTDASQTTDLSIKLGDLIPQSTLVWKANWIDATHSRNITSNRLWEEMVQTRKGFPKREVDVTYVNQLGTASLDTGATGHADGYPCVVTLNGQFYGIGTLNIGKKRDNYNMNKDNKKQVQFELLGGGTNFVAETPPYANLGLRNPKLKNYNEGNVVTDPVVAASIQGLWDFHRLPLPERTAQFDANYDRVNMVDWYLLISFTAAADLLDKNSILTSWDGKKYYWMPYDLDTTFGLHWNGSGVEYLPNWDWDEGPNIIPIVKPIIINDVIKRYAELRKNEVFSLSTVYRINRDIETKFSLDLFKREQLRWDVPSKDVGGINQIMGWLKDRIKFLDAKFNYLDDGVLAQKMWNPPTLVSGGTQTTTLPVAGIAMGTKVLADFGLPLQGTKMTAAVTSVGVVTVTHTNPTSGTVNLDYTAVRVLPG